MPTIRTAEKLCFFVEKTKSNNEDAENRKEREKEQSPQTTDQLNESAVVENPNKKTLNTND